MEKVLAAGGIVTNEMNEILLIFRYSKWDLPKGHVEKGEPFEDCALREVKEETGLQNLSIIKYIGTTEHEYYDNRFNADVIKETHWFEMKANKNQELHGQVEEDIQWVRWVSKNELKKYLHNSYSNICEILKKAGFIEDLDGL